MHVFLAGLALAALVRPVPDTVNAVPDAVNAVPDTAVNRHDPGVTAAVTRVRVPVTAATRDGPRPSTHGQPRSEGGAGDGSLDDRRKAIATEIVKLGVTLRRSIEAGAADALLARVPSTGLRCGDRVVPRERVERDLRTQGSWLHDVMFGDAGPSPHAPRSLRAFFRAVPDTAIVVGFRRDPTAGAMGRPCLDYRAEGFMTPGSPLCFELRDGTWWLIDSLYPCR